MDLASGETYAQNGGFAGLSWMARPGLEPGTPRFSGSSWWSDSVDKRPANAGFSMRQGPARWPWIRPVRVGVWDSAGVSKSHESVAVRSVAPVRPSASRSRRPRRGSTPMARADDERPGTPLQANNERQVGVVRRSDARPLPPTTRPEAARTVNGTVAHRNTHEAQGMQEDAPDQSPTPWGEGDMVSRLYDQATHTPHRRNVDANSAPLPSAATNSPLFLRTRGTRAVRVRLEAAARCSSQAGCSGG